MEELSMIHYRIYEYITTEKAEREEYRVMGCRAGMQRLVYEGTSNLPSNILLNSFLNENNIGYRLARYDVVEFLNLHKVISAKFYYSNSTFYPFNMYDYNPDPDWESKNLYNTNQNM